MEKLQKTITELNDKLKKKNKTPEEQDEEFEQFYECIKDIATHPVVLRMKLYPHHGVTNCYQHCLHVSYYNYIWCKALDWMQGQQRVRECCMICFCTTGIPMQSGQGIIFMG